MMGYTLAGLAELLERQPGPGARQQGQNCRGFRGSPASRSPSSVGHEHRDNVSIGDVEIELLHTPGHTPGSQCFLLDGRLVAGDTLFLEGCGRTDFPGGDAEEMYRSLQRLAKLDGRPHRLPRPLVLRRTERRTVRGPSLQLRLPRPRPRTMAHAHGRLRYNIRLIRHSPAWRRNLSVPTDSLAVNSTDPRGGTDDRSTDTGGERRPHTRLRTRDLPAAARPIADRPSTRGRLVEHRRRGGPGQAGRGSTLLSAPGCASTRSTTSSPPCRRCCAGCGAGRSSPTRSGWARPSRPVWCSPSCGCAGSPTARWSITPAGLVGQWREELERKFGLPTDDRARAAAGRSATTARSWWRRSPRPGGIRCAPR